MPKNISKDVEGKHSLQTAPVWAGVRFSLTPRCGTPRGGLIITVYRYD